MSTGTVWLHRVVRTKPEKIYRSWTPTQRRSGSPALRLRLQGLPLRSQGWWHLPDVAKGTGDVPSG